MFNRDDNVTKCTLSDTYVSVVSLRKQKTQTVTYNLN